MVGGADVRRSAVIVGRSAQRAALTAAVEAAAAGVPRVVALVGEGGIGKTRLLADAIAHARQRGLAVLTARAPITAPHPFGVVTEALRSHLREHPRPAGGTVYDHGLRLLLPEWPVDESGPRSPLSESQLRLLALEATVRLIRDIAESPRAPGALVVLDDLHGADPDSIELARYLSAAALPGVAVLMALRPREQPLADELVRTLHGQSGADVVRLEPLDAAGVTELVTAIATAAPPPALVEHIMGSTDGVPLLVEEVIAAHLRAGSVGVAESTMVWRGDAVAVPSTVRDLVAARLDRLDAAQRDVLVAGAVLGDLSPDMVAAVSGRSEVDEAVAAGIRVGLLEAGGDAVSFRHAIVRDAVLHTIGPQTARRLHRAAAQVLATHARDDDRTAERRAAHLAAAGDDDAAALLLAAAAHRRVRTHALLSAEALARDAVRLARDPATQANATDALVRSLAAQGRWSEALDADTAAMAVQGDTPQRRHRMALNALEAGRPELAATILERARAAGDTSAWLELAAGRVALVGGDAQAALAHAANVLDSADDPPDPEAAFAALDLRARAFDFLGERERAEAAWSEQVEQARRAGHTQAELRGLVQLGKIELFAGRPVQRLQEAVDLAQEAGALVELAWAEENLSIAYGIRGELDASAAVLDDAIPRCRMLRLDQLPYLLVSRAAIEGYRSEGDEYARWLDEAESLMPTDDLRLHALSVRSDIALRDGRYDDAIATQRECLRIAQAMPGIVPVDSPCYYPWSLMAAGHDELAREAVAEVRRLPGLERWHTRPLLLDVAEALLARDVDAVDRLIAGAPALLPIDRAIMRQVGAVIVGGAVGERWLREAYDTFAGADARRAAERVRQMLRASGGRVPRSRAAARSVPPALAARGVTDREAEVLRLVGEGLSNADIADRLVVSVRTVESHVSALLSKLGVARRGQLAATTRHHFP